MADGPLLLSGARTGVLVRNKKLSPLQIAGAVIGIAVVLIGAFDIVMRIASRLSDPNPRGLLEGSAEAFSASTFEAPPTPQPLTPARLRVPALGIDAPVEPVGVNALGAMASPSSFSGVAWYRGGARPGEKGNAVLAGHLTNAAGTAGVFEELHLLAIGDEIEVRGSDGRALRYIVRAMSVYPMDRAPREDIFIGDKSASRLVLVTCNGAFDRDVRSYDKRLVVTAELSS